MSSLQRDGVNIGTISGGIVNFGGAVYIAPISVTKTTSGGSGGSNASSASVGPSSNTGQGTGTGTGNQSQAQTRISDILGLIRTML